jgi:hypothetical protein
VRALGGRPLAGATVTLYAYDAETGSFLPVPDGDAIMAPINRANPDTTDEAGHFGWDLSAGIYKIRAEKAGCVAPAIRSNPSSSQMCWLSRSTTHSTSTWSLIVARTMSLSTCH